MPASAGVTFHDMVARGRLPSQGMSVGVMVNSSITGVLGRVLPVVGGGAADVTDVAGLLGLRTPGSVASTDTAGAVDPVVSVIAWLVELPD